VVFLLPYGNKSGKEDPRAATRLSGPVCAQADG
jgi:hypothetical protein